MVKVLLAAAALVIAAAPAAAHPAPFSYLDIVFRGGVIEGTLVVHVIDVAHDLGISVPGQLSIISFDDTPGVRSAIPPMTAIRQPIAAMAARAAEMLIARSRGEEPDLSDPKMPHRLVERASTAPPPSEVS